MYIRSKIKRAAPSAAIHSKNITGQTYMALCESFSSTDQEKYKHWDFFIENNSLDEISEELKSRYTLHGSNLIPEVCVIENDFLRSTDHKYVIYLVEAYYHFIVNTLISILFTHRNNPNSKFVIFYRFYPETPETIKNKEFLIKILEANGVECCFADSRLDVEGGKYAVYRIENFTVIYDYDASSRQITLGDVTDLLDLYVYPLVDLDSVDDVGSVVYISREESDISGSSYVDPNSPELGYKDNRRLYSESSLEEYLESKGVYILKPSKIASHWDQVAILQKASTLIGVTGTGLINSLMMREGQTVIELKLELIDGFGKLGLIDYYSDFAYAKGHTYIALDIPDKQAATAVERLEDLFKKLNLE
jgi:hypothetical protein